MAGPRSAYDSPGTRNSRSPRGRWPKNSRPRGCSQLLGQGKLGSLIQWPFHNAYMARRPVVGSDGKAGAQDCLHRQHRMTLHRPLASHVTIADRKDRGRGKALDSEGRRRPVIGRQEESGLHPRCVVLLLMGDESSEGLRRLKGWRKETPPNRAAPSCPQSPEEVVQGTTPCRRSCCHQRALRSEGRPVRQC